MLPNLPIILKFMDYGFLEKNNEHFFIKRHVDTA